MAKLLPEFIIFLVHCQSVNTEVSTVNGVEGKPAVFQWTVNRSTFPLGSLRIFNGTDFDITRVLFTLDVENEIFTPSNLAKTSYKGRLNATISGDVRTGLKFNCTLTLYDLQLSDRNQKFYLYAAFVRGGEAGKVITLVDVQGIYCFCPFLLALFNHERHDVAAFK